MNDMLNHFTKTGRHKNSVFFFVSWKPSINIIKWKCTKTNKVMWEIETFKNNYLMDIDGRKKEIIDNNHN